MVVPIACPACSSLNQPDRVRCRVCGRLLRERRTPEAPAPVVLKRVLSGEVFTALLEEETRHGETSSDDEAAGAESQERGDAEAADDRRFLRDLSNRVTALATRAGRKFKPYAPAHGRKPATPESERVVARHLEAAVTAFRGRAFDEAVVHLLKALAKEDGDPRAWLLLGEAYLRQEEPYKAAVGYLRSLDLDPSESKGWLGLARTLQQMGDAGSASEVLERVVRAEPLSPEAWLERGLVEETLGNLSEAVRSFARVLDLRPDHPVARERRDALQARILEDLQILAPDEAPPPGAAAERARPPENAPEAEDEWEEFAELTAEARETPAPAPERAEAAPSASHPLRVPTFIEGLDGPLGGGIPWGHVVLLQGAPGTMKSSLGFSILLRNATEAGRHGLYLSLEERASSLLRQMGSLGLPLAVDRGSLVVLDPRAAKGLLSARDDWVAAFREALATIKRERGLDLLVIDSLEALEVLARFEDRRREIFRLFEWLRDLDVTSFVITERPDLVIGGQVLQGRWDEDFLADGVVHLRQHLVTDLEVQRRLRVVKMRGTRHESGYLALVLDDGRFRVTRAMSP